MKKADQDEAPIDVCRLRELLIDEWQQNSKGVISTNSPAIMEYGEALKRNVSNQKVKNFILGLKQLCCKDQSELQGQMLLKQFVKDNLGQDELEKFKDLIEKATFISARMKRMLLFEL